MSRISARWMWPQTTVSTPRLRAACATASSKLPMYCTARLGLVLEVGRQRPVRQVELAPHPVDVGIGGQQDVVDIAAELGEPGAALDHAVEFVAVQHQHAPAVRARVDVFAMDLQVAEYRAVEIAEHFVVVARDEDHLGAALGLAEDRAQHVVVRLRPEHGLLHAPDVDDVADQEQRVHLDVMQEIEQQLGAAALESQMDVRNEDRSQLAAARGRCAPPCILLRSAVASGGQNREFVVTSR